MQAQLLSTDMIELFDRATKVARAQTLPHFFKSIAIDNKLETGFDPVTEADRNAELALRDLILQRYQDHDFIGEEFAPTGEDAAYRWVIDPIDGTRSFITGVPLWGTLIGLIHGDKAIAGAADIAALDQTYIATQEGAYLKTSQGTQKLATSQTTELTKAALCSTDPYLFDDTTKAGFERVRHQTRVARYGTDCYGYCLLAAGQIDVVVEPDLKPVDIVALIPIVEQAGGVITNWAGEPAIEGGHIVAAATPQLHQQALDAVNA